MRKTKNFMFCRGKKTFGRTLQRDFEHTLELKQNCFCLPLQNSNGPSGPSLSAILNTTNTCQIKKTQKKNRSYNLNVSLQNCAALTFSLHSFLFSIFLLMCEPIIMQRIV